jgi:hypothetical protein
MKNLLPLVFQIVVDLSVSDGHHDDQDSKENHADQELVEGPHGNGGRFQVAENGFERQKLKQIKKTNSSWKCLCTMSSSDSFKMMTD